MCTSPPEAIDTRSSSNMPISKDDLLGGLASAGVQYDMIEHAAAQTVDAQAQALASSPPGHIIKNLFLKVSRWPLP